MTARKPARRRIRQTVTVEAFPLFDLIQETAADLHGRAVIVQRPREPEQGEALAPVRLTLVQGDER